MGLTTATPEPDAVCPGCGAPGESDALCFRCHAQAPTTLAAIRAGEIPSGSVRASVCPTGERCSRCRVLHRRVTPAYWDASKRYCTSCCGIVAAELDGGHGTWPPQPTGDPRAGGIDHRTATAPLSAPPVVPSSAAGPVVAAPSEPAA